MTNPYDTPTPGEFQEDVSFKDTASSDLLTKRGMSLYLVKFEFISGENGQRFESLFYAKTEASLEKKIHRYLRGYYGEDGLDEVDGGDTYLYLGSTVAVKNCGWEKVEDMRQIVDCLMAIEQ